MLQEALPPLSRLGRGLALAERLVRVAAVLSLVDGFVDAANGAVEAWLAEYEGDYAVF